MVTATAAPPTFADEYAAFSIYRERSCVCANGRLNTPNLIRASGDRGTGDHVRSGDAARFRGVRCHLLASSAMSRNVGISNETPRPRYLAQRFPPRAQYSRYSPRSRGDCRPTGCWAPHNFARNAECHTRSIRLYYRFASENHSMSIIRVHEFSHFDDFFVFQHNE
jgi:hypothetical protein